MDLTKLSDADLVSLYISGNENGLSTLVNRHNPRIFNFIYSKVLNRDITEDIFQDTFIKVINTIKRGKYNEEGKFLPWVMRIAHNLIIDHFRKNNRIPKFDNSGDFDIFTTDPFRSRDDYNLRTFLLPNVVVFGNWASLFHEWIGYAVYKVKGYA